MDLADELGTVSRATLFDSLEQAAARIGLAVFVVRVSTTPPTIAYGSALLAELIGRPLDEVVGKPPWELVVPGERDRVREFMASRGTGAPPTTYHSEVLRPDGTVRKVDVGVARIVTGGSELAVCYFRDRTDEHAAVEALRRSVTGFRSLIENAPDGVVILQQGRIVLANPAALRMFGETDVLGRLLSEFLPPAEAARAMARIAEVYKGKRVESSEYLLDNGIVGEVHSALYEYEGKPAILAFVRDVSERRRMHEQLFRADRLAALGTMAATVAHEINNPLTYLQLSLQRLEREAAAEPDPARAALLRDHIANAIHGVERVARIVRDLRAYSRDQTDEPDAPLDVVSVVGRARQMVEHDLRHRAQLVRRFPATPAIVDGSAPRLEQVVINLLVNAIQALDASRHNTITVEVAVADQITISVTDTGPGLTQPDRIFEPFFTTKPVGEGTGLGLSVCKQLVERMRGTIAVGSTGPQGTRLEVALPRSTGPPPRSQVIGRPARGERMRILVVDDEPQVLTAIRGLLETEHEVDAVESGDAALARIAERDYQVILCDVMMPRMNGRDVFEQIQRQWPGLERRIVFITGGAFVPALAGFLDSVDNLKLRKPFTVEHLLALVQDAQTRA